MADLRGLLPIRHPKKAARRLAAKLEDRICLLEKTGFFISTG